MTTPANPPGASNHAQSLVAAPLAAVTGASGFIGRHLVPALVRSGWRVRLLLRRDPALPDWQQLRPEIVPGAMDDPAALASLVEGATAIIHLAGLIKATRRRHFFAVNSDNTAALARIVRTVAPGAHFVLVSSLAARVPTLSHYAASKRAGEAAARSALGSGVTILRPPAVYGPGDRESLRLFQLARRRIVPLPVSAAARVAMIHVRDLARLIVALAREAPSCAVLAAADARPQGYRWDELLSTAARAVGNDAPRLVRTPDALLRAAALAGDLANFFGSATMLSSQKLRELRHPDWSVSPQELARPRGWLPEFDLETGFAETVAWYRSAGWLPG